MQTKDIIGHTVTLAIEAVLLTVVGFDLLNPQTFLMWKFWVCSSLITAVHVWAHIEDMYIIDKPKPNV